VEYRRVGPADPGTLTAVPAVGAFFTGRILAWPGEPPWWRALVHAVRVFVMEHQTGGLFLVIFFEELGIPLPVPGDVAIAYGGYLTTTGAIPYPMAYVAVVAGAVLGSACNLTISRRFGRPFVQRFGRYVGITEERMVRAEQIFKRWGPWAIILGRHIPGMRIVLSAFS
jgi:membrane protein DedA with SNARE-associated domain